MHHHMQITLSSVILLLIHSYIICPGWRRCHMAGSGWESGSRETQRDERSISHYVSRCCFLILILCREHLSDDHYQTLVLGYYTIRPAQPSVGDYCLSVVKTLPGSLEGETFLHKVARWDGNRQLRQVLFVPDCWYE